MIAVSSSVLGLAGSVGVDVGGYIQVTGPASFPAMATFKASGGCHARFRGTNSMRFKTHAPKDNSVKRSCIMRYQSKRRGRALGRTADVLRRHVLQDVEDDDEAAVARSPTQCYFLLGTLFPVGLDHRFCMSVFQCPRSEAPLRVAIWLQCTKFANLSSGLPMRLVRSRYSQTSP